MPLLRILPQAQPTADLRTTYDAIVVGSGAAGGMAAHVLPSRGLKVLLLEAGRKLDIESELKSMEWPYDHPRRGDMPPGHHPLSLNEYNIRQPPYATKDSPYPKVYSYVQGWGGADYSKNFVVNEKDHPYTGTRYAWVRARTLGGKTTIWGRLALRLSDYDFKAKSHDGYGEDWPILPVRLQEMFGCKDTPRIVNRTVPVVLHLLSPAKRPVQVTKDLASFWANAYPEVRKELRGRYPKHHWPDDPLVAEATARIKPRK